MIVQEATGFVIWMVKFYLSPKFILGVVVSSVIGILFVCALNCIIFVETAGPAMGVELPSLVDAYNLSHWQAAGIILGVGVITFITLAFGRRMRFSIEW